MNSPTSEEKPTVTGYVISLRDYKENDGIVTLATEDGLVDVHARGVQKETSKNRRLCLPHNKVTMEYDPKYSRNMLYLIHGTVEQSWYKIQNDLESQALSAMICALLRQHQSNKDICLLLEKFWDALSQNEQNSSILYATLLLKEMLYQEGLLMDVDECVICGERTGISSVSMEEGGFVCARHPGYPAWKKKSLKKLRMLVKVPAQKAETLEEMEWKEEWLLYFVDWYCYHKEFEPASVRFWRSLDKSRQHAQS